MPEYSDYLEVLTPSGAITGPEKMGMSQSGSAAGWTPALMAEYLRTSGLNPYTFPFPQFTTATSTTAYTGTPSPAITAYATGQKFQVKAHATSTGASTLALNGLAAKKVFINPTTQATTGDLVINSIYLMFYDAALDGAVGGFLMVGGSGSDVTPDWYNVTLNGLVGDGVTANDTAFDALIALAPANSVIYFPPGTYIFSAGHQIDKPLTLIGDGPGASIIETSANVRLIEFTDASVIRDARVEKLEFYNSAATPASGAALYFNLCARAKVFNTRIYGFYNNVFFNDSYQWEYENNLNVGWVNTAISIINAGAYIDFGDTVITSCEFLPDLRNATYGIFHQNSGGLKMSNCKFNWGGGATYKMGTSYYYDGAGATVDLMISNCSFENFSTSAIRVGKTSGSFQNIAITGNQIAYGPTNNAWIDLDEVSGVAITGNALHGNGGTSIGIRLTDTTNVLMANSYANFSSNVTRSGTTTNTIDISQAASASQAGYLSAADWTTFNNNAGSSFWTTVPGTPVRSSNTVFTITDVGNANLYDKLISRLTVLKWTDTTTKMAMVVSATYAANVVTVNIIGDVLSVTATMNTVQYAMEKARLVTFAVAGTLVVSTDIARKFKAPCPCKIFGADALHGTAGTTNASTYDLNKNGTTMFTTKISIASGATVGSAYTADDGTELDTHDIVTLDCDSVSTTAPIDVYVDLFYSPLNDQYLS